MMDLLSPHLDELERPQHNGGKKSDLFYFIKRAKGRRENQTFPAKNKRKRNKNKIEKGENQSFPCKQLPGCSVNAP